MYDRGLVYKKIWKLNDEELSEVTKMTYGNKQYLLGIATGFAWGITFMVLLDMFL